MGIGHQALALFEEIIDNKNFSRCKSVVEAGSQFIDGHYQERAKLLLYNQTKKIYNKTLSAKEFYQHLGFEEYKAIDADGERGSIIMDFNENLKKTNNFSAKFDLVTNFGTSEHVFNQSNFFENIHNLTKKDGLMIHVLPFEGYFNHGYFNYHPIFFFDLAIFNNYEILGYWYFSEKPDKFLKYYGTNFKALKYNENLIEELDKLIAEGKIVNTPKTNHSSLGIVYKKLEDQEFKSPFQGKWLEQCKIDKYKGNKKADVNKVLSINQNVNNKNQIEENLGGGYWKNKIKRSLTNYKYLIKNIKLLLNKIGFKFKFKGKYWERK